MSEDEVRRPLTTGLLALALVLSPLLSPFGESTTQRRASLWLRVTDLGTGEVLPGVQVRLLRDDKEVGRWITGSDGELNASAEPGEYTLEHRLDGYQDDPETTSTSLSADTQARHELDLVRADGQRAYYEAVAGAIQRKAESLGGDDVDKRTQLYLAEWVRVLTLDAARAGIVARGLNDSVESSYLAGLPSLESLLEQDGVID